GDSPVSEGTAPESQNAQPGECANSGGPPRTELDAASRESRFLAAVAGRSDPVRGALARAAGDGRVRLPAGRPRLSSRGFCHATPFADVPLWRIPRRRRGSARAAYGIDADGPDTARDVAGASDPGRYRPASRLASCRGELHQRDRLDRG